jgi:hypothetical protein
MRAAALQREIDLLFCVRASGRGRRRGAQHPARIEQMR